ncbi:MAG TPA: hypothetical protein VGM84_24970 [Steroidobacteraceae bacterium]|jgi:hypothetical protein
MVELESQPVTDANASVAADSKESAAAQGIPPTTDAEAPSAAQSAGAAEPAWASQAAAAVQSAKAPVGLILCLIVAALGAMGAAAYAGWLGQQRELLQLQLAADEKRLLDLREQLTRSEVLVQEREAALATRDAALAEATQPDLPVRVSFRPAWMGQGMVATFRNVTSKQLSLMVEIRDPQARRSKDFALDVSPGDSADIGHAQGWLVTSGQSIKVGASGYKSVTAFAP